MPYEGGKTPDEQEPGLRPGRGVGAEFAGRAPRTPQKNIRALSLLFVFVNVHPTPIVRCAAIYLGRPPPDGGCRALRSVGVMAAAMDLSRLFQRPKYRFTSHFTSSAPLSSFLASPQPAFPSTHTRQTRHMSPLPITQAVLTGPGVERYRKPDCWAARVRM